ncbi:response regulator [Rhodopirellula islandica]|uniref:Response regulator n=1 Tax=Rhodopirellula islandica TaxID=595434 RepID=A0A0J1EDW2_RHOIS|nr:response regulator [Rhodopirellula islandica]KLU03724.1 response regulator [Rhodopirellula islandica]
MDDDTIVLRVLRRSMEDNYDVETAESGQRALEILRSSEPISCVVSDMRMPAMDGIELVQTIAIEWPEVPCIILTGNQDEESERRAINESNVFRLMNKPSPRIEIIEAIESALQHRREKRLPPSSNSPFTVSA